MKSRRYLWPLLLAGMAVLAGCSKAEDKTADREKTEPAQSTGPPASVNLDSASQERLGVAVETLASVQVAAEVKGYGRVLDPGPLSGVIADFAAARTASQISEAELNRTKILAGQKNASERALQAASAAFDRDQGQLESARLKLLTALGPASQGQDLASLEKALAAMEVALVKMPDEGVAGPVTS